MTGDWRTIEPADLVLITANGQFARVVSVDDWAGQPAWLASLGLAEI